MTSIVTPTLAHPAGANAADIRAHDQAARHYYEAAQAAMSDIIAILRTAPDAPERDGVRVGWERYERANALCREAREQEGAAYLGLPNGARRWARVQEHRHPDGTFCCPNDVARFGYV